MRKLFIAVMLLTLASCYEPNVKREITDYVVTSKRRPLTIISVDGCQYLFGDWGGATVLTHKGNCTNPMHKFKSE